MEPEMSVSKLYGRYEFEFDPYIKNSDNRILKERHIVASAAGEDQHFFVPKKAPFFSGDTLKVRDSGTGQVLRPGIDYKLGWLYAALNTSINLLQSNNEVYWAICITNKSYLDVLLEVDYHTIGDKYVLDSVSLATFLKNEQIDPKVATWDSVKNKPAQYASDPHLQSIDDFVGWDEMVKTVRDLMNKNDSLYQDFLNALDAHTKDESNPHANTLLTLGISRFAQVYQATVDQIIEGNNDKNIVSPKVLVEALQSLGVVNSPAIVSLKGPTSASRGSAVEWEVTNYDSFSNYSVSSNHGNFRVTNGKLVGNVNSSAPVGDIEITIQVNSASRKINLRVT